MTNSAMNKYRPQINTFGLKEDNTIYSGGDLSFERDQKDNMNSYRVPSGKPKGWLAPNNAQLDSMPYQNSPVLLSKTITRAKPIS